MFDFFLSHCVIPNSFRDLILFSKMVFDFSFITSLFLFFHKNYYYFTKGKEPARSPKPAVSFPLNPFLFGHGLGHRPKNPPASEIEVSSVSCEQICVGIFVWRKKTLVLYWNKETPKFIWSSPRTVTKPPVSQLGRLYFFTQLHFKVREHCKYSTYNSSNTC